MEKSGQSGIKNKIQHKIIFQVIVVQQPILPEKSFKHTGHVHPVPKPIVKPVIKRNSTRTYKANSFHREHVISTQKPKIIRYETRHEQPIYTDPIYKICPEAIESPT